MEAQLLEALAEVQEGSLFSPPARALLVRVMMVVVPVSVEAAAAERAQLAALAQAALVLVGLAVTDSHPQSQVLLLLVPVVAGVQAALLVRVVQAVPAVVERLVRPVTVGVLAGLQIRVVGAAGHLLYLTTAAKAQVGLVVLA